MENKDALPKRGVHRSREKLRERVVELKKIISEAREEIMIILPMKFYPPHTNFGCRCAGMCERCIRDRVRYVMQRRQRIQTVMDFCVNYYCYGILYIIILLLIRKIIF